MLKLYKRGLRIIFVLLALFMFNGADSSTEAAAANPPSPVGVVDVGYLINQHPDTAKANAALKTEQETDKKEFIEKSAGLSEADKQALDRQLGQRLEQKRQELLRPIIDSINEAMKTVAYSKGLTVVVYKNNVALGGTDITEEVLKKITGK